MELNDFWGYHRERAEEGSQADQTPQACVGDRCTVAYNTLGRSSRLGNIRAANFTGVTCCMLHLSRGGHASKGAVGSVTLKVSHVGVVSAITRVQPSEIVKPFPELFVKTQQVLCFEFEDEILATKKPGNMTSNFFPVIMHHVHPPRRVSPAVHCHSSGTRNMKAQSSCLHLSTNISSIALIGPQSNRVTLGDYFFFNASKNGITPLRGFTEFLANASVKINFAEGCRLWSNDEAGFPEAGRSSERTPGTNVTTGEHVDLSDLSLVGAQFPLVQVIQATGTPTIVVFVSGKPVTNPWIQENVDAVIQQFYPGELGGLAVAEIIFGAVNPSGRLPVSFPRSIATAPAFYNYLKGGRPIDPGAIYPNGSLLFGQHLIPTVRYYTKFNYTDLQLSCSTIRTNEDFSVTVTVDNCGSMDGKEVVQVYMTDRSSSVVTPNKELIGFTKVDIPAGQSRTVSIPVMSSQLAVCNQWVVEPGNSSIFVGTSEELYLNATLTVQ
ncbi:hypothetical protein JVT61DRAFT_3556 [Boletus reticuloceps]|uniref:beta-glucosidase n=1 Tax=Boletus reticuloceps TaxID=495285 RepID=A0A8I2YQR6_9AGAM|nr:hypothetical protein JVT61DRAFT_3556 [Boletus reticuloceps]